MLKIARLAVLPVLVLALTGCTNSVGPKTIALTGTPTAPSVTETPSSTPTGTPITTKQAATLYLDAVCPANANQLQVGRAGLVSPMDLAAVRKSAAAAAKYDDAAIKTLSDPSVIWPGTAEQDRFTVAGDFEQLKGYFSRLKFATSEDDANTESPPEGSDAVGSLRKALGIDGDRVLLCVGHNYSDAFPKGYPRVLKTSAVPPQPRSSIEYTGAKKAVEIAPGVYGALTPGADVSDVATGDSADGFCPSVKSYERKYLFGNTLGGSCW